MTSLYLTENQSVFIIKNHYCPINSYRSFRAKTRNPVRPYRTWIPDVRLAKLGLRTFRNDARNNLLNSESAAMGWEITLGGPENSGRSGEKSWLCHRTIWIGDIAKILLLTRYDCRQGSVHQLYSAGSGCQCLHSARRHREAIRHKPVERHRRGSPVRAGRRTRR